VSKCTNYTCDFNDYLATKRKPEEELVAVNYFSDTMKGKLTLQAFDSSEQNAWIIATIVCWVMFLVSGIFIAAGSVFVEMEEILKKHNMIDVEMNPTRIKHGKQSENQQHN